MTPTTPASALAAIVAEYRQQQPGRRLTPFPVGVIVFVGQAFDIYAQARAKNHAIIDEPVPMLCERCLTPIVIDGQAIKKAEASPRVRGKKREHICLECYAFTDSQFSRDNV